MSSPVPKPVERYTYEDYLSWDDGKRWELINGVAYDMSPAPRPEHQFVAGELFGQIRDHLKGKPCLPFVSPMDVTFRFEDGTLDAIVQPDVLVICDRKKIDNRGCNGAPDLVIEILSERTAGYDMVEKRELYERNRVPEYWIVNPWDFTISAYRIGENSKYGTPRYFTRDQVLETVALPGLKIELSKVFVKL